MLWPPLSALSWAHSPGPPDHERDHGYEDRPPDEASDAFVDEDEDDARYAEDGVAAAVHFAATNNMTGEQMTEFVSVVRERLESKTKTEVTARVAATVDNDGPAEALFI